MWKWFIKKAVKNAAGPVIDAVFNGLEKLAKRTDTTIDDNLVATCRRYKDKLIPLLISGIDKAL